MNTYNENLHSSVVEALSGLEMDRKMVKSQLNASKFKLYYGQGAKVTAAEKLEIAERKLVDKKKVKKAGVINSNIATNLLASADSAKKNVDQSVTNVAVGAANVQIASNAIVRLASDMGSILSIVKAENMRTDIYESAKEAYSFINSTAYNAELTSQHAMEASALTAEVSSTEVAEKAKSTHEKVDTLLKVASAEFDTAQKMVTDDNNTLALASTKEKAIEGNVEDINVAFVATDKAYGISNKELNMNLRVEDADITNIQYTVNFDYLKSPFWMADNCIDCEDPRDPKKPIPLLPAMPLGYPVDSYNIFLVKDSKKTIFSISDAENIMKKNPAPDSDAENSNKNKQYYMPYEPKEEDEGKATQVIDIEKLFDSDGQDMKRGTKYVVFVLAAYNTDYKKKVNNFGDYLSAASETFSLRFRLKGPDYKTFDYISGRKEVIAKEDITKITDFIASHEGFKGEIKILDEIIIEKEQTIFPKWTFKIDDITRNGSSVDYRCMFLPADFDITHGLLTDNGLETLEHDEESVAKLEEKFDPMIEKANDDLNQSKGQLDQLKTELAVLKANKEKQKTSPSKNEATKGSSKLKPIDFEAQIESKHKEIELKQANIDTNKNTLETKMQNKKDALAKIELSPVVSPGIFFDLTIAENVPAGNYVKAKAFEPKKSTKSVKSKTNVKDTPPEADSDTHQEPVLWEVQLKPEVTDNFGNPLINGNSYVPVVYTRSIAPETFQNQYLNIISDFAKYASTKSFTYTEVK